MSSTFFEIWTEVPPPSPENDHSCSQFNGSNLWVLRDTDDRCGVMITGVYESVYDRYENIEIIRQEVIKIEGVNHQHCLIFKNSEDIDAVSFAKTLSAFFEKNGMKSNYTVKDLLWILVQIEEVTKSKLQSVLDLIGVWGELYVLKSLFESSSSSKAEVLNGWESSQGRTIIDFSLLRVKRKVEVKTTKQRERVHHINSLEQLQAPDGWTGNLASVCVLIEEAGQTCKELIEDIEHGLDITEKQLLYDKIEVRGKDTCLNDTVKFILNKDLPPMYVPFEDVPKPKLVRGVSNLEFDIHL